MSEGYVYLIGVKRGLHKIGKSFQLEKRLKQLSWQEGHRLRIVHRIPTDRMGWLEKFLHHAFSHRRIHGEWFRLSRKEVTLIRAISGANETKDLPPVILSLFVSTSPSRPPPKESQIIKIDPRTIGLLEIRYAAERLRESEKTVLRRVHLGQIPVVIANDSRPVYLIRREDLDRFEQPKRGPVAK